MAVSLADRMVSALARLRSMSPAAGAVALTGLFAAIQIVRLFWTILTPVTPVGDWQPRAAEVMPASARAALFASFDPFFRSPAAANEGNGNVTSLQLTLFGIRANESSGSGSAIIAGQDGVQNSYAVGEEVAPGVTLEAVAFDHVILNHNGAKETLYLDQSVPAETVGTNPPASPTTGQPAPTVAPASGAAFNPQALQQGIGFAPRNENGKATGIVLSARDDGTMLRNAGFRPGDIITSINGRPVSSPADIASQLRPGARLSFEVERGAGKIPVNLVLEQ